MNPLLNTPNGTIVMIVSFSLSQRIPAPADIIRAETNTATRRKRSDDTVMSDSIIRHCHLSEFL